MASCELDDDKMNSQVVDDYSHIHGLSRLATCSTRNSTIVGDHNFEADMLSRLSIESIDIGEDADEEPSEDDENDKSAAAQADSGASYSLPGTPLQHQSFFGHLKQYASENETRKSRRSDRRRRWKRRVLTRENMKIDDEQKLSRDYRNILMPSRLTISAPMLDTGGATTSSGGGSSPISNWLISSPGDDPKDVKARLKVWAQAVAFASTSPRSGGSC